MHGYAFRGGRETRYFKHRVHQRLPVVWPGAAHQRAIDIEQNQVGQDSIVPAAKIIL